MKVKTVCLDSERAIQWFWVTLLNLLASASITAASAGLSAPGGHSCPALPVRSVFHEHQHQQQEGQSAAQHPANQIWDGRRRWRLFLFLSEQEVEVHEDDERCCSFLESVDDQL